jgi:hypothetical protein
LALAQSALIMAISATLFVLLGFLVICFDGKRTAKRIREYLQKCNEMNQEPTVFDLVYNNYN